MIGFPLDATVNYSYLTNGIKNNRFTSRDIKIYKDMLGPSRFTAKGKTTKKQLDAVDLKVETVKVLTEVKIYYTKVEVLADIMYVDNVPFLTLILYNVYYDTITVVNNLKYLTLKHEIRKIIRCYSVRRFNIAMIHVDK